MSRASTAACCSSRGRSRTQEGGPFKVYSPFWRACLKAAVSTARARAEMPCSRDPRGVGEQLADWKLLPTQAQLGQRLCVPSGSRAKSARASSPRSLSSGRPDRLRRIAQSPRSAKRLAPVAASAFRRDLAAAGLGCDADAHRDAQQARARTATNSCPRSAGASSPITCCTISRLCPSATGSRLSTPIPWATDANASRGLAARHDRLSDRRCRHARTVDHRLHAQSRAHGRRELPDQASAHRLARRAKPGSGIRWSMPTSPTTPRAGSGSPAAAPMPRPISASSIRWRRAANSIPTASTSAAGVRSWRACRTP